MAVNDSSKRAVSKRAARLEAELRANLKKRKAQAKARAPATAGDGDGAPIGSRQDGE